MLGVCPHKSRSAFPESNMGRAFRQVSIVNVRMYLTKGHTQGNF